MASGSFSPADIASMPRAEFAFPGSLRDRLVAAILDGSKTSTTALVVDYEHEGEPIPEAGDRSVVIDSEGRPVAVIEVTGVPVVPVVPPADRRRMIQRPPIQRVRTSRVYTERSPYGTYRASPTRVRGAPEVLSGSPPSSRPALVPSILPVETFRAATRPVGDAK